MPNDIPLKDGDIISVDCGTLLNGFCGDSAYTFCVGEVAPEIKELLRVTKEALYLGIENAVHGKRLGDIGFAIQSHCEAKSYGVVKEFVGHGIGKELHEDPQVPNFRQRRRGMKLVPGMTLAIEPMVNIGRPEVCWMDDDWTVVTEDESWSAHYENTVLITEGEPELLSIRKK